MESESFFTITNIILLVLGSIVGLTLLLGSFFTTNYNTRRIVERFGKFVRVAHPGLSFKLPLIESVSAEISLQVQQFNLGERTYTKGNTSVTIEGAVQYQVGESDEEVKSAYYKLEDPTGQIKSHVAGAIGAKVPTMTLSEVQERRADIGAFVKKELLASMKDFGYIISDVPITAANPSEEVVKSNNDKYASEQNKETAANLAEANYSQVVKAAQAEKERKRLAGEGVAAEREAIAKGIAGSASIIKDAMGAGMDPNHVMDILLTTQGYDAMRDIAGHAKSTVVFLPNSAKGLQDLLAANGVGPVIAKEAAATPAPASEPPVAAGATA